MWRRKKMVLPKFYGTYMSVECIQSVYILHICIKTFIAMNFLLHTELVANVYCIQCIVYTYVVYVYKHL